jgi:hypothetical protein
MAFVLVLLLSITTLVRVETEASSIKKSTLQAQQNALLGLQVGLGRLQSSAGRDRVATGTIEVDPRLTVDPTKRYWTGTWTNLGEYDAERNLMPYGTVALTDVLVPVEIEDSNLTTPVDPNWPILLGAPTVETATTPTQIVRAPALEIDSASALTNNTFSYWVADEGVKARVDLSDPAALPPADLRQQDADSLVRLFSTPRTGTEQMRVGIEGANVGDDFPSDPNLLARVADTDALALLFPQGENFTQSNFHDLTVHSTGLFTDQRLGGLRQDLTWMLRNDDLPDGFLYKEPVSVSAGRHSRDSPPGPAWSLMQDFYDKAVPGPLTPTQDFRKRDTRDPSDHPISLSPLVTQVKLYFNFAFGPPVGPPVGGNGGNLRMYLFPVVVLNNPYNRPLAADDYGMRFIQHNTGLSTQLEVVTTDGLGDPVRTFGGDGYKFKNFNNALFDPRSGRPGSSSDNSGSIRFYANDLAFEPGETKILTLSQSGPYLGYLNNTLIETSAHQNNSQNSDGSALTPGFDDSNSAYIEFKDTLDQGENPDFYSFELKNPGNIRFELSPKNSGGQFLVMTVNYKEFQNPDDLPIGTRLTRTDTTFPSAGFTYTMDLENIPHLADFNPRSTDVSIIDNAFESGTGADTSRPPRLYRGDFGIGEFSTDVADPASGAGYFGPSHTSDGFLQTVLFEIPQSPDEFVSLGQFKHLDLSVRNNNTRLLDDTTHHAPAYIFGNSRADPRVGTGVTFSDISQRNRYGAAFDFSYRTNEAIWDGFFFSTAPNIADEMPLNRRIVPTTSDWGPPADSYDAAKNLSLAGAFNVNSVSVNAWRAILSGLQDHDLETVLAGTQNDVDFLFGSHARPLDGVFNYSGQSPSAQEVWNRARSLSPAEIDALAVAIVSEVKERGPFLSLAHFVNRSLGAPSKLTESGALQSAINLAEPSTGGTGLNDGLGGQDINPSDLGLNVPSPELFAANAFDGAPGRLTQADLLTALGPILNARSDTFRIRAYGESEEMGNTSKAWCEAIVRRIPEKIDSSEPIEDPSTGASFGRRFEVVSFRWLPPQE